MSPQLAELWSDANVEHGFDANGKLIAERSPDDPTWNLFFEHREGCVVGHIASGDEWIAFAMFVPHNGSIRVVEKWPMRGSGETTRWSYGDGPHGVERVVQDAPRGVRYETHYERSPDGRLVRVVQKGVDGNVVLWPVPGRAEVARAVAAIGELREPLVARIREVASPSGGLAVLSYTDDGFAPPVLSWVDPSEFAGTWMIGEWRQPDLSYIPAGEQERWLSVNDAAARKPRSATKALVELARTVRDDLSSEGWPCCVVALPLEVTSRHEKLIKKQLTSDEQAQMRRWGMLR
jgi:hypothetical protein